MQVSFKWRPAGPNWQLFRFTYRDIGQYNDIYQALKENA